MFWIQLVRHRFGTPMFLACARVFHGLEFRVAGPASQRDLHRFRFGLYREEGYIRPQDHPDGTFTDKYAGHSVSVVAEWNGEIIGAARATHYSEVGLPTLEFFNLRLPAGMEPAATMEMGRFMIDRRYRGKSRLVAVGLSAARL